MMPIDLAHDDASALGILSSNIHAIWTLAAKGRLGRGDNPPHNETRCFQTFPFPDLPEGELKNRIRDLGERLDAHRKARLAEYPELTLAEIYNVLEKLRNEEPLTDKDKVIHDQGLITLLKQIHDDLDQAVYEAYGWSDIWQWHLKAKMMDCYDPETGEQCQIEPMLSEDPDDLCENFRSIYQEYAEKYDQVLLQRLVDLNHERAAKEAQGRIRHLRPDFQDPDYDKKVARRQQATSSGRLGETSLPDEDGRLGETSLPDKLP